VIPAQPEATPTVVEVAPITGPGNTPTPITPPEVLPSTGAVTDTFNLLVVLLGLAMVLIPVGYSLKRRRQYTDDRKR
jgi:LPXTG-motif cell wall-anchored protein